MTKQFKIFITIFLILISYISNTYAQDPAKYNAIELHPWQRWELSGHNSNCLGLTYVRTISSKFDLCGEMGLRFIDEKLGYKNNEIGYLSIGSRYYFKKSRTFNTEAHFLYDNKKLHDSDQKVGLKIGAGLTTQITDALHVNINGGLLMDRYNGMFYIGISLGHKF
jgi:hypothetical protein